MKSKALFIGIAAMFVFAGVAMGSVPHQMNYQGYLTDAHGNAITATLQMKFSIWAAATGGIMPLWSERQPEVPVTNGLFNVILGELTSIPDHVFTGPPRWLQTEIQTKTGSEVLSPRRKIVSLAYAFRAEEADTADYARDAGITIEGGLTLPFTGSGDSVGPVFKITNTRTSTIFPVWQPGMPVPDPTCGGLFSHGGPMGIGVYGKGKASGVKGGSDTGTGVSGTTKTGTGVKGSASGTGDVTNYGGYFVAQGDSGRGVYGEASGEGEGYVENYGGYFVAKGAGGRGVYGYASATGSFPPIGPYGVNYGGYFEAKGNLGRGIYAKGGGGPAGEFEGDVKIISAGNGIIFPDGTKQTSAGTGLTLPYAGTTSKTLGPGNTFSITNTGNGRGVTGYSKSGWGVYGRSETGSGVRGYSPDGYAGTFKGKVAIDKMPIVVGLPVYCSLRTGTLGKVGSSARFKEDIEPLKDDFHKILEAKPKSFTWKENGEKGIGFIAEEFDALGLTDLVYYEDGQPFSIRYELVPLYLLEVIKDQVETTKQLKEKNKLLEQRVEALEKILQP